MISLSFEKLLSAAATVTARVAAASLGAEVEEVAAVSGGPGGAEVRNKYLRSASEKRG